MPTLGVWWVGAEAREMVEPTTPSRSLQVVNARSFPEWQHKDAGVVAQLSDLERHLQHLLASNLARDADAECGDLHATLLAALLVAGSRALQDRFLASGHGGSIVEGQRAVVDYAVCSVDRPLLPGRVSIIAAPGLQLSRSSCPRHQPPSG